MKILCICNQGENRSRTTAEILMALARYDVKYDGFYKDRLKDVSKQREKFDPQNLDWADKIIVFEEIHEDLLKKYGYSYWGKSFNLNIEDMYHYNQKSLIVIIKGKLMHYEFL